MDCNTLFPSERRLDRLHPVFRARVEAWLAETPQIAVHEAWRSEERQQCLRRAGKSWVHRSKHQDGLAVDVHFKTAPHFPVGSDARWNAVRASAKKHGLVSGYTLWGTDANHFQWHEDTPPHSTVEDIMQAHLSAHSALWHTLEAAESQLKTARETLHQMNNQIRAFLNIS